MLNRKLVLAIFLIFFAYIINQLELQQETEIIKISTGLVQGVVLKSRGGNYFDAYRGIPFAKAPIDGLRYEAPQPPEKWDGIKQASKYGSKCVQIDNLTRKIIGSEDCLFINVFIPKKATVLGKPLNTLVYIHGGYFQTGLPENHGPEYFMDENIILVHFGYRVNSFGFLNTGDDVVRGNMGLKDQVMALKWVQENIQAFGGDPLRVTLFGGSAGGASVNYHLLSPMSKNLFSKAIIQSGTSIKLWSFSLTDQWSQAKRLGSLLNCSTENSKILVTCLKKTSAYEIANIHKETLTPLLEPNYMFLPSIESVTDENTFLSKHPYELMTRGEFQNKIPTIFGILSQEGLLITGRILHNLTLKTKVENEWNEISSTFLIYNKSDINLTRKIQDFYSLLTDSPASSKKLNLTRKVYDQMTNMFSDRLYISPMKETVQIQNQHLPNMPIYLYYYNHVGENSIYDFMYLMRDSPNVVELFFSFAIDWFKQVILRRYSEKSRVCHGDDLIQLFKFPFVDIGQSSPDYHFSRELIKLWVQFANNHQEMYFDGVQWTPLIDQREWKYLEFTNDNKNSKGFKGQLVKEPFSDRMIFWKNLGLPWVIKPSQLFL